MTEGPGGAVRSDASAPQAHRGFAAVLLVASLLAAAATAVVTHSLIIQIAAGLLVAAASYFGTGVVARRRTRTFPWVVLVGAALGALWGLSISNSWPALPVRSLQFAVALTYAAILTAGLLRLLRVLDAGRALLVTFAVAVPVFVLEVAVPAAEVSVAPRWKVTMIADPQVGARYAPNSVAANYYPDNPRGYFEQTDPLAASWTLELHQNAEAQLEPLAAPKGFRVAIAKPGTGTAWEVKLKQEPFEIRRGRQYVLTFHARADRPRRIAATIAQSAPPWDRHAPYWEADVPTEWTSFEYPFSADGSDQNARLFFDLGSSAVPVEVAEVSLREASGRVLQPRVPAAEYFVRYRFNSQGFRGPEYAIPQPPGTFRILALGDSYTLGVGVREEDTFTAVLQAQLNSPARKSGGPIAYEVVNAGVSGFNTLQERRLYETHAAAYTPQVVLLVMVFNDDLSFADEQRMGLIPSPAGQRSISNLWSRVQASMHPDRSYDYTAAMREVLELNAACVQRNARLGVVVFRNTSFYKPWEDLLAAAQQALQGTGIPLLDLHQTLLGDGRHEEELMVHPKDGHPNEVAHHLAAAAIERFLASHGMLQ